MSKPVITTTLTDVEQKTVGTALQETLTDLIDLSLVAKQVHWTVVGRHFRALHLALDEIVSAARTFTDEAAERAVAIGVVPDGRAGTVHAESTVPEVRSDWIKDDDVTNAVTTALGKVIERLRKNVAVTEDADPVTQDLLIAFTARIEQLHWMWQAQQA